MSIGILRPSNLDKRSLREALFSEWWLLWRDRGSKVTEVSQSSVEMPECEVLDEESALL